MVATITKDSGGEMALAMRIERERLIEGGNAVSHDWHDHGVRQILNCSIRDSESAFSLKLFVW